MIIEASDFDNRPYKVPNQEESPDFVSYIVEKEQYLAIRYLLGCDLWDDFAEAIEGSGVLEQKWIDLRDGANYVYGGVTYKYGGWVDMIRPAVYSLWQPDGSWKFTNVGWVQNKASSAPQAGNQSELIEDPYAFMVKYWNEFVTKVGFDVSYGYNCKHSFYGFMKVNESNYPGWVFSFPHFKNRHDI